MRKLMQRRPTAIGGECGFQSIECDPGGAIADDMDMDLEARRIESRR